jgi:hypothetical protein
MRNSFDNAVGVSVVVFKEPNDVAEFCKICRTYAGTGAVGGLKLGKITCVKINLKNKLLISKFLSDVIYKYDPFVEVFYDKITDKIH